MTPVLGLDVGGANLKAAHTGGSARSRPFALWRDPAGLPGALRELVRSMPGAEKIALTMTGELCDCFESKRQGVRAILDAAATAAGDIPVQVFALDGTFRDLAAARARPLEVAAGNWLALATFAGRYAPEGPAVLLDVGSTTTDVVPLVDGRPVPEGRNDPARLRSGELAYTGVRRTPLCAVLAGEDLAAELFATTRDAYLVVGLLPEGPGDHDTADGRPATRTHAHARLARMTCADLETSTEEERVGLAGRVFDAQSARVASALGRVVGRLPGPPRVAVLAGEGDFLAEAVLGRVSWGAGCRRVVLAEVLGREVSRAACAYAAAVLLAEGG